MNNNKNLRESYIDNIDVRSQLEQQIQNQETKDSGWRSDKITSRTKYFYKTTELNGSNYVNVPLRSPAKLNIENHEKYCFLRSILAHFHPCENGDPNRLSNYRQYFDKLNIDGFIFTNVFKCSVVYKIKKIENLSRIISQIKIFLKRKRMEA